MKMLKKALAVLVILPVLLLSAGGPYCCPAAAEGNTWYVENEWNYVSDSMDVSGGIPEDASGVLARIERNGVLRVATVASLVPRVFRDPENPDQFAGSDIRLARCIADRMGVALKIVPLDETQLLPSLLEDQCDLAIAALSYTPARALSYTMSKAYYYPADPMPVGLIIREESRDQITSLADLEDRILAARSNSLPEILGAMQVADYREYRRLSPQGVYEAVSRGEADAGLVLVSSAETYMRMHPDCGLCMVDGLNISPERAVMGDRVAAKKGEAQLIYFVNGVIDGLLAADAYEDWLEEARELAEDLREEEYD